MAGYIEDASYAVRDFSPYLETIQLNDPLFISLFKPGTYKNGVGGVCKNTKHIWYDRAIDSIYGTIDTESASGQKDVILGTGEGANFLAGDEVAFLGPYPETGIVASVATDTLTLASNLTYTHAVAVKVKRVSRPVAEGGWATRTDITQGSERYNYVRNFGKTYGATKRRMNQLTEDDLKGYLARSATDKAQEVRREMNNAALFGTRIGPEQIGVTKQLAGGLFYFIGQNPDSAFRINAAGERLSGEMMNDANQVTGGRANIFVMHSDQARVHTSLNQSEKNKYILINQETVKSGVAASVRFLTDIPGHKEKMILVDDNMPVNQILLCNSEKMYMPPMSGCALVDEPVKGSSLNGVERSINGDYTFELQDVYTDFAMIYNLASRS